MCVCIACVCQCLSYVSAWQHSFFSSIESTPSLCAKPDTVIECSSAQRFLCEYFRSGANAIQNMFRCCFEMHLVLCSFLPPSVPVSNEFIHQHAPIHHVHSLCSCSAPLSLCLWLIVFVVRWTMTSWPMYNNSLLWLQRAENATVHQLCSCYFSKASMYGFGMQSRHIVLVCVS